MPRLERLLTSRGYEVGSSGQVTLDTFARYFEHLRWESAAEPSLDLARMFTNGHRMVVRAQQVQIDAAVGVGEQLRLKMWIGRIGRASMDIWHEAVLENTGRRAARGLVTAVYLGGDLRPSPVPDDFRAMIDDGDTAPIMVASGADAPSGAWSYELRVRPSDIDIFHHVNHANYAAFYEDARTVAARSDVFGPRNSIAFRPAVRMAIDYRREVLADDRLLIASWRDATDPLVFHFDMRRARDGERLSSARTEVGSS